jgi:hypothetical protein
MISNMPQMVVHNNYAEDKFAQEFGIKVCSDLVSVPARVLPPPLVNLQDSLFVCKKFSVDELLCCLIFLRINKFLYFISVEI